MLEQWTNWNQEFVSWTNRKQGVLLVIWQPTPNKYNLSHVFTLTAWKMANMTANQRLIQSSKTSRGSYLDPDPFLSKYLNSMSWPSPFKEGQGKYACGILVPTLQRHNTENSKQIFPEKELPGYSPNSYIHVSVSDLYISTMVCQFCRRNIGGPIVGIYI